MYCAAGGAFRGELFLAGTIRSGIWREKNWCPLLERDRELVGFSTILAYETTF